MKCRFLTSECESENRQAAKCTFRREKPARFGESFVKVLALAQKLKLAQFGRITVSVDGTKLGANSSKPAAARCRRLNCLLAACGGLTASGTDR